MELKRDYRINPFAAGTQIEILACLVERLEALVEEVAKLRQAIIIQGGK
jgi:hypothetical protein